METAPQRQTLEKLGIYLPYPVYSHGMLYVAFSRCTPVNNIRIALTDTTQQRHLIQNSKQVFPPNVVYTEVLQQYYARF
jgi:hypothetical protein